MNSARILVVEDDPDQLGALADFLRAEGYTVSEAESAEAALDLLQASHFDLIVTDYQLGGATGAWLARMATASLQPSPPRVLMVTGHERLADTAGLNVLSKPLDVARFLAEVKQALTYELRPTEPARPAQRIAFVLYVSDSLSSRRTINKLQDLFAQYVSAQISFNIVDLSKEAPHQAEEHRIVATPTLLKTFPAPRIWITGEFEQPHIVVRLLEQAGVEIRS